MKMMSKFNSEFPPDELLMALFIENITLKANIEVCKKHLATMMLQAGKERKHVEAIFSEDGLAALDRIITDHKYLSNEWKDELKNNLFVTPTGL